MDCAASSITGNPGARAPILRNVGHLPKQIDGNHSARPRGDGRRDLCRIDVECRRIDVDEHRRRPGIVDRARGREEGERRCDYFVAAADIEGPQGQQQCVGTAGTTNGELGVRQPGDRAFEATDLLAENKGLRVDDIHHRPHDFILDRGVLGAKVEKGDGHRLLSWLRSDGKCPYPGGATHASPSNLGAERQRDFPAGLRRLVDAEDQLERFPPGAAVGVGLCLTAEHGQHVAVIGFVPESVHAGRTRVHTSMSLSSSS